MNFNELFDEVTYGRWFCCSSDTCGVVTLCCVGKDVVDGEKVIHTVDSWKHEMPLWGKDNGMRMFTPINRWGVGTRDFREFAAMVKVGDRFAVYPIDQEDSISCRTLRCEGKRWDREYGSSIRFTDINDPTYTGEIWYGPDSRSLFVISPKPKEGEL